MTCTCNKDTTAKIDWTKPIQVYSYYHGKWVEAKLLNTLSQGDHTRIVQTDRGVWAFNDWGYWEKDNQRVQVRNKPIEWKTELVEIEIFRSPNGKYSARVASKDNSPMGSNAGGLIYKGSVPVAFAL